MVITNYLKAEIDRYGELSATERGGKGFGSTGKH